MARREQSHLRVWFRVLGLIADSAVVVLVVVASLSLVLDLPWLGGGAGTRPGPAAASGLTLPAAATPVPFPPDPEAVLDPAAVRAALRGTVLRRTLGPHLGVAVAAADSGRILYRTGAGLVTPASTTKLLTSVAALALLGPATRFHTSTVISGRDLYLVGGGDPYLERDRAAAAGSYPARADLATLARRTATALRSRGIAGVRLRYDTSLFRGPGRAPSWPATYATEDVVPPISALWVDQGHNATGGYLPDPARTAAAAFRTALLRAGVGVSGPVRPRTAPAAAGPLAQVDSAPLSQIVEELLALSDNNAAEVIGHQVGVALDGDGSFAGGATAVRTVLGRLGVDLGASVLLDGSGLSRSDLLSARTLLEVLGLAASPDHPTLRAVLTGLPVAGFSGTLAYRFEEGPAAAWGRVRAKTGTLTGVHGLAGLVTDLDGRRMLVVAIADRVPVPDTLAARRQLELIFGALAGCRCGPAAPPSPTAP